MKFIGSIEIWSWNGYDDNNIDEFYNITTSSTVKPPLQDGSSKAQKIIAICVLIGMVVSSMIYWKYTQYCIAKKAAQEKIRMNNEQELETSERF